jgi:hypothetical protein
MELPRDPTVIPQARRYEKSFYAIQGRAFKDKDEITINIPQFDKTYLTKNVKLHFTFNLKYYESSTTTITNMKNALGTNASAFFDSTSSSFRAFTKPVPTFDINGPYGLINRIQVFSYLNNTLLEDIPQHDVLTAQFADQWLKNDIIDIDRPYVSDVGPLSTSVGSTDVSFSHQQFIRKQSCANIYLEDDNIYTRGWNITYAAGTPNQCSTTLECSLDLFSFLGRFSDKFVPLHNGFKIVFTLNDFARCIKFNTAYGNCQTFCKGSDTKVYGFQLDPYLDNSSISNVYLKTELLEVSPELDEKVDKLIYASSWKYQQDFFPYSDFTKSGILVADVDREPFRRRILPDLRSVTKVYVGQRPLIDNKKYGKQELGFRLRNYTKGGKLLYNKTEVAAIESTREAWQMFQKHSAYKPDVYLRLTDFNVDELDVYGTNGNQFNIPSDSFFRRVLVEVSPTPPVWWVSFTGSSTETTNGSIASTYTSRYSTLFQGRYLLCFNSRIPGATENSVAGIDTSKAILEYEITPENDVCQKVIIDVFVEHDAFIHVDPGKSTSVTF